MANILGNSSSLGYNLTNSGAYTNIAPLTDITTPKPSCTVVNVSSLTDAIDIKLPGFTDNGEFSATIHHSPGNLTLVTTTLFGLLVYYQITLNDTHTFTFQAILKDYTADIKRNELVAYKCTFAISGAIVEA